MPVVARHASATAPTVASVTLADVVSLAHLSGRDCDGQSACGHQQHGKFNGQSVAVACLGNVSCGGLVIRRRLGAGGRLVTSRGLVGRGGSGLFRIDVFKRHARYRHILRLLVERTVVGFYKLNRENIVARLDGGLAVGRNLVFVAEDVVDGVGISPVRHARVLLAYAETLAGYVANLALRTLNGEKTLVLARAIRGNGCRYGYVGVILNLANADVENLELEFLNSRCDVAALLNDLCEGEGIGGRLLAGYEVDVLVEIQEALCLLGAVILDEVDGRTLAIDGDGVGQAEIFADGEVLEDCRNVIFVGVLGVDFGRVDREAAVATGGVFSVERDVCVAANGQVADRPQGGIGGGGRLDGGAANRQIAAGEQARIDALCHNAGVRNANVAARCAVARVDERGVAAIFRRRDIDHAAVFDNEVDGVDACIQRGRRDLRIVERDRAVASDANSARGVNDEARFAYRNIAGNAYAVLSFSRDVNCEVAWPRDLDAPPAAMMPISSSKVMELLP